MLELLSKYFIESCRRRYGSWKSYLLFFIYSKQGAFAVSFVAMIPVLLGFLALGWEGSRYIYERARLSDTLEQAALALTAENNGDQTVSAQNRNQLLVDNYISAYFYGNRRPIKSDILIEVDNSLSSQIQYRITAENTHRTWLLSSYFPSFSKQHIVKDKGAAQKNIISNEPMDVVFVADFSNSMNDPFKLDKSQKKIDELKKVLLEISDIIYKNPKSHIGFTPFAWGANNNGYCFQQFTFKDPPNFPDKKKLQEDINNDPLNKNKNFDLFLNASIIYNIEKNIDYKKTIEWISDPIIHSNSVPFSKFDHKFCLNKTDSYSIPLTRNKNIINEITEMNPDGYTLISSGILSGAELLFKGKNKNKLLVIISDGEDNPTKIWFPGMPGQKSEKKIPISKNLVKQGMCEKINKEIGKIIFIAIDYDPYEQYEKHRNTMREISKKRKVEIMNYETYLKDINHIDWAKECVGKDNFYISRNTLELKNTILNSIKNSNNDIGTNIVK